MTGNRVKCLVSILMCGFILGMVGWQFSNDTVFVGKGPAARNVSAQEGWLDLAFEGLVGIVGMTVSIYWFAIDYSPGSRKSKSEPDGSDDLF